MGDIKVRASSGPKWVVVKCGLWGSKTQLQEAKLSHYIRL